MSCCFVRLRYARVPLKFAAFLCAGLLSVVASTAAADHPAIVRVEEDWELVVQLPEVNTDAPQVTCVISPGGDLYGVYAAFELNHHTQPDYAAGGLQLQLWNDGFPVSSSSFASQALLQQPSETIRWTQQMKLNDGKLWFAVVDGTSSAWGDFGGQGNLKVGLATDLNSLAGYQPDFSTEHTAVGFAGNRVTSLKLKEVRWYSANGLEARDTTDRVVHPQQ